MIVGVAHEAVTCSSPLLALNCVTAKADKDGVTGDEYDTALLGPTELLAVNEIVYDLLLVNPITVQGLELHVMLIGEWGLAGVAVNV